MSLFKNSFRPYFSMAATDAETAKPKKNYAIVVKEAEVGDPGIQFSLKLSNNTTDKNVIIQQLKVIAKMTIKGKEYKASTSIYSGANRPDFFIAWDMDLPFVLPFQDLTYDQNLNHDISITLDVNLVLSTGNFSYSLPLNTNQFVNHFAKTRGGHFAIANQAGLLKNQEPGYNSRSTFPSPIFSEILATNTGVACNLILDKAKNDIDSTITSINITLITYRNNEWSNTTGHSIGSNSIIPSTPIFIALPFDKPADHSAGKITKCKVQFDVYYTNGSSANIGTPELSINNNISKVLTKLISNT